MIGVPVAYVDLYFVQILGAVEKASATTATALAMSLLDKVLQIFPSWKLCVALVAFVFVLLLPFPFLVQ